MATRMQQRRGTSTQWAGANPVLNIGEIGYETDTNQFKIGDGVNHWADLSYFVDEASLNTSLDGYVETSILGVANGVATLNASGKLESSQVPNIDELAQDAVDAALVAGSGITKTYDDGANTITVAVDSNVVATLTGTQTLSNKTLGNTVSLGANLNASTYTITGLGTPTNSTDAATKSYVDAVAEGLHIHASVVAATTANVNISTDLEAGDVLDGITLVAGDRILVKNQSSAEQNGIYIVQASGAALRASDFNQPQEVDGGDFVFVTGGTVNDNTGWVQTATNVVTIGTDPITFTQFIGAGTYTAGNGLSLAGTQFSINTAITADLSTSQTLSNKTLTAPVVNLALNAQTGTTFTPALVDNGRVVTLNNGSAILVTVPTNNSVAYPTGAQINLVQLGAGQVTVQGDGGVTVNGTPGLKFRAQYSVATLIKVDTNSWILTGDLSA